MHTFIILKPDAIYRCLVGEIISRFEREDMCIVRIEKRYKNENWFKKHYQHLWGPLSLNEISTMANFMVNKPLIGIILNGNIKKAKEIVGHAIYPASGTIRSFYGAKGCRNLIHASDSPEAVAKEIELFFQGDTDAN